VNILRGDSPAAQHARKTACAHGHAYSAENTWYGPNGSRYCNTCNREKQAARRARWTPEQREAGLAQQRERGARRRAAQSDEQRKRKLRQDCESRRARRAAQRTATHQQEVFA
jgi:hypothetical protein